MTPVEALKAILEIAYEGHPDGRATRLEVIQRLSKKALKDVGEPTRAFSTIRGDTMWHCTQGAGLCTHEQCRPTKNR